MQLLKVLAVLCLVMFQDRNNYCYAVKCLEIADGSHGTVYSRRYGLVNQWRRVQSESEGQVKLVCANGTSSSEVTCIRTSDNSKTGKWYPTLSFDCCSGVLCGKHGSCFKGDCSCFPGWVGKYCNLKTPDCAFPCLNGGVCVAKDKCYCPDGWGGQQCSIDILPEGWQYREEYSFEKTANNSENWIIYQEDGDATAEKVLSSMWCKTKVSKPSWLQISLAVSLLAFKKNDTNNATYTTNATAKEFEVATSIETIPIDATNYEAVDGVNATNATNATDEATPSLVSFGLFLVNEGAIVGPLNRDASFSMGINVRQFLGLGIIFNGETKSLYMVTTLSVKSHSALSPPKIHLPSDCIKNLNTDNLERLTIKVKLTKKSIALIYSDDSNNIKKVCMSKGDLPDSLDLQGKYVLGVGSDNYLFSSKYVQVESIVTYFGPSGEQEGPVCQLDPPSKQPPLFLATEQNALVGESILVKCPVNMVATRSRLNTKYQQHDIKTAILHCTGLSDGTYDASVICTPNPILCDPVCNENNGICLSTGREVPRYSCVCFSPHFRQPDCAFNSSSLSPDTLAFLPLSLETMFTDGHSLTLMDMAHHWTVVATPGRKLQFSYDSKLTDGNYQTTVVEFTGLLNSHLTVELLERRRNDELGQYINNTVQADDIVADAAVSFVFFIIVRKNKLAAESYVPVLSWVNAISNPVSLWLDPHGRFYCSFTSQRQTLEIITSKITISYDKWQMFQFSFRQNFVSFTNFESGANEIFNNGPANLPIGKSEKVILGPNRFTNDTFNAGQFATSEHLRFSMACLGIFKQQLANSEFNALKESCWLTHGYHPKDETDDEPKIVTLSRTLTATGYIVIVGSLRYYGEELNISWQKWPVHLQHRNSRLFQKLTTLTLPLINEIFDLSGFRVLTSIILSFERGSVVVSFRIKFVHYYVNTVSLLGNNQFKKDVVSMLRNITDHYSSIKGRKWPKIRDLDLFTITEVEENQQSSAEINNKTAMTVLAMAIITSTFATKLTFVNF